MLVRKSGSYILFIILWHTATLLSYCMLLLYYLIIHFYLIISWYTATLLSYWILQLISWNIATLLSYCTLVPYYPMAYCYFIILWYSTALWNVKQFKMCSILELRFILSPCTGWQLLSLQLGLWTEIWFLPCSTFHHLQVHISQTT